MVEQITFYTILSFKVWECFGYEKNVMANILKECL